MQDQGEKRAPKKRAAALQYNPEKDNVPILSAIGEGFVAEKIIETAKEAGVPIVPDANLTSLLAKMSVGDEIPPDLYEVVAKVLIFVSEMDRSYGERIRKTARDR